MTSPQRKKRESRSPDGDGQGDKANPQQKTENGPQELAPLQAEEHAPRDSAGSGNTSVSLQNAAGSEPADSLSKITGARDRLLAAVGQLVEDFEEATAIPEKRQRGICWTCGWDSDTEARLDRSLLSVLLKRLKALASLGAQP